VERFERIAYAYADRAKVDDYVSGKSDPLPPALGATDAKVEALAQQVLAMIEVEPRYAIAMLFLKIVAVLGCAKALHGHLIYDTPLLISLLIDLQGFLAMAATVIFCVAMQWLSRHAGLERSAGSWKVTTILFILLYLIPLGLFYLASLAATATGESFRINLGIGGLALIPVFLIPLVHFFISTSRMRDEAKARNPLAGPPYF
jgi:hypothetical protein